MATFLGSIALPDDLHWTDEHQWSPVARSSEDYSLTGALLVEVSLKLAGRPITLSGGTDRWISTTTLAALQALNADPLWQGTLTLADSRSFTVMFRDQGITATPVVFAAVTGALDGWWQIEILLRTVC